MSWITDTVDGVTIQRREVGEEGNPYYESFRRSFIDSVGLLASRLNTNYAVAEPFSNSTGLTLTNGSIANGYAQNTVQAGAEPLPTMTSDSAPAGNTTAASSVFNTSYPAWKMWNKTAGDLYDCWASVMSPTLPQWCRIYTASPFTFRSYRVYGRYTGGNGNPTAWELQTSTDGTNWATIDTQSGQNIALGGYKEYELPSDVTTSRLRLLVSAFNPGDGVLTVGGVRVYAAGTPNAATILLPNVTPVGNPVEGYVLAKIMNVANPGAPISVGPGGSDLVSVSLSTNGGSTYTALSFGTPENAQEGYFRFTSSAISLTGQTGLRLRIQTHNRGAGAPNVRIDDAIIVWRDA